MWINAQRDGRPAEYWWRPLFNAAKFGWRPLLECRAVTLPRRETRWNLLGCPKLTNGSQLLAGQSPPYCEDMWGDILLFNKFFSDCRYMTYLRRYSPTKMCDGAQMANFWRFFRSCIFQRAACSTFHTCIYRLHSKFTLGPHHVSKCGRHPTCDRWDYTRKKKKETGQKYNVRIYYAGRS